MVYNYIDFLKENINNNFLYRNTHQNWLFEFLRNGEIGGRHDTDFTSFSKVVDSGGMDNFGGTRIIFNEPILEEQGLIEIEYDRYFFEDDNVLCGYVTAYSGIDWYYKENGYEDEDDYIKRGIDDRNILPWDSYIESFEHEQELVIEDKLKYVPDLIRGVQFTNDEPTPELLKLLHEHKIRKY